MTMKIDEGAPAARNVDGGVHVDVRILILPPANLLAWPRFLVPLIDGRMSPTLLMKADPSRQALSGIEHGAILHEFYRL